METQEVPASLGEKVLSCGEEEFDKLIPNMGIQDMIETITCLQSEMEREQVLFEDLSNRLPKLDPSDPEHEEVTNQLVVSQTRLAMLASRNMKCFSQQTSNQNQALMSDMSEEGLAPSSPLKIDSQLSEDPSEKTDTSKPGSPAKSVSPAKPRSPAKSVSPDQATSTVLETSTSQQNGVQSSPKASPMSSSTPDSGVFNFDSPTNGIGGDRHNGSSSLVSPAAPTSGSVSHAPSLPPDVTSPTQFTVRSSHAALSISPSSQKQTKAKESEQAERINFAAARSMFESSTNDGSPTSSVVKIRRPSNQPTRVRSVAVPQKHVSSVPSHDHQTGPSPKHNATVTLSTNHQENVKTSSHNGSSPSNVDSQKLSRYVTESSQRVAEPVQRAAEPSRRSTEPVIRAAEPSRRATEPVIRAAEPSRRATEPVIRVSEPAQRAAAPSHRVAETTYRLGAGSHGETHFPAKPKAGHHKTWMQTVTEMGNQSCTRVPKQEPEYYLPAAHHQSQNEVRSSPQQQKEVRSTPPQQKEVLSLPRQKEKEIQLIPLQQQGVQLPPQPQQEVRIAPQQQQEVRSPPQPQQEVRSPPQQRNEVRSPPQQHNDVRSSLQQQYEVRSPPQQQNEVSSQQPLMPNASKPPHNEVNSSNISKQEQHFVTETKSAFITNAAAPLNVGTISSRSTQQGNNGVETSNQHVTHENLPSSPVGPSHTVPSEMANGLPVSGQSVFSKPVNYDVSTEEGFTTEDKVKDRVTLKHWDPTKLVKDVYKVTLQPDNVEISKYINMEGYMEKLPQNKTKATLLKTWKRRFFKAKDGVLYYYESKSSVSEEEGRQEEELRFRNAGLDHATGYFQLMGGTVQDLGNRMLGIDDGRGRYLITRCPTDSEFLKWKRSLDTQTIGNIRETYVKPVLYSPPNPKKKVVVIDLGSCSVRAGLLGEQPSLPHVFFPTAVATHKETGAIKIGFDVLKPEVRLSSTISFPVRPTANVDKFTINMDLMAPIFGHVFKELKIEPKEYLVMLSSPARLSDLMKGQLMDILVTKFKVAGANIVNQTVLSLYSYSASSGIVVDIGERLEIVPITDGYIVENGVTRQPYGGHRIADHLNATLAESKYHFFTHVDFTIVRKVMEELCFVSQQYEADSKKFDENPACFKQAVKLDNYNLPDGFLSEVCSDVGRFRAAEGLFDLSVWGMDNPPLHKLVQKAVQACPMDTRREMWRSIYLSGGVTKLPGFCERLQTELMKIVPGSIVVQVQASPQRYHAAYIGACVMAGISEFELSCITAKEWREKGSASLVKWQLY